MKTATEIKTELDHKISTEAEENFMIKKIKHYYRKKGLYLFFFLALTIALISFSLKDLLILFNFQTPKYSSQTFYNIGFIFCLISFLILFIPYFYTLFRKNENTVHQRHINREKKLIIRKYLEEKNEVIKSVEEKINFLQKRRIELDAEKQILQSLIK